MWGSIGCRRDHDHRQYSCVGNESARRRLRRSVGIQFARIVGREEPMDDRDLVSFDLRLITESNLLTFVSETPLK
jgi:hypothetical protein